MDPAHVVVSHHGIVGNRYNDPSPFEVEMVDKLSTQNGFTMKSKTTNNPLGAPSYTSFRPPSLVQITTPFEDGSKLILSLYVTPTEPGFCRHIGSQVFVKGTTGKSPPGIGPFALPMPKWLLHISASLFLHQDGVFLHHQEKILAQRGYDARPGAESEDYGAITYMCNSQDKGVISFRQWLKRRAGGGVPYAGNPALPPRDHLGQYVNDVYNSHVKHCRHCLGALSNLKRARIASFVASAIFVLARPVLGLVGAAVGAVVSAALGGALGKLIGLFYSYEYRHSDND